MCKGPAVHHHHLHKLSPIVLAVDQRCSHTAAYALLEHDYSTRSLSTQDSLTCSSGLKSCFKGSTPPEEQPEKKLCFSTIQVWVHPVCLGDNPAVSSGPPLTIGWKHEGSLTLSLDEFEAARPQKKCQLLLPRFTREEWLREIGYSRGEIKDATAACIRIQRQRLATMKASRHVSRVEEGAELLQKKLKKWLVRSPPQDCNKSLYNNKRQWATDPQQVPGTINVSSG